MSEYPPPTPDQPGSQPRTPDYIAQSQPLPWQAAEVPPPTPPEPEAYQPPEPAQPWPQPVAAAPAWDPGATPPGPATASPDAYQAFTPAAPPPRRGNPLRWALFSLAALLMVAIPVGAFFALGALRAAPDKLDALTPADADAYTTVLLDPSVGQKANLLQLVHHFPGATTDVDLDHKIGELLDKPLGEIGLSYAGDVKPWLGGQAAMYAKFPASGDPSVAVLVASKDDAAALRALDKARAGTKDGTWSQRTHDGVQEWIYTPSGSGRAGGYALLSHTVVIGDTPSLDAVIDTAHGRHAALKSSADYQKTLAALPADHLSVGYVNLQGVLGRYRAEILKAQAANPLGDAATAKVQALMDAAGSLGWVVVAQPTGLELDSNLGWDSAKLDAGTRALLGAPAHSSTAVPWIPATTYGFVTTNGLKQAAQSLTELGGNDPSSQQLLEQMGLTGPRGLITHLTGDAAVEVDQGGAKVPDGAIIAGTDDPAGFTATMDRLSLLALTFGGSCSGAQGAHGCAGLHPATKSHGGVTIHYLNLPAIGGIQLAPAYAVAGGMGMIATSPDEIARLIDAHQQGNGVATTQLYRDAVGQATTYQSLTYLDVERLVAAADTWLTGSERTQFDNEAKPYLNPVKAISATGSSDATAIHSRLFILIR